MVRPALSLLSLLLFCAATIAQISTQLLNATVGGSVLIPCSLPGYQLSLTWFYWQESGNLVFHWDSKQNPQPVAEKYKNRCQVFETEFTSGNISIRLDKVTVEDDVKTFRVYVRWYDEQKKVPKTLENECQSELQVSAPYQHLDLTVNSTANRATCTAHGGYPEPQLFWTGRNKSSAGQLDLQDAETSLQQDPTRRTFTFTSSVSVRELQSVTCCVYNPHSHERIDKTLEIDAPDEDSQQHHHLGIIAPVIIITIVIVFVCVWLYRKYENEDIPGDSSSQGQATRNEDGDASRHQEQTRLTDQGEEEEGGREEEDEGEGEVEGEEREEGGGGGEIGEPEVERL